MKKRLIKHFSKIIGNIILASLKPQKLRDEKRLRQHMPIVV